MNVLEELFERLFHAPPTTVRQLQGQLGGSGRRIARLSNQNHRAIGILYDVREENAAFIEFSRHFWRHGLPVPEIYAEDLAKGAYLEQDLGDTTLFDFLSQHRSGDEIAPKVIESYRTALSFLPRFQVEAGRDLNYKVCYPRSSFDRQSIAWDLNYFKYYFLRLAGIPFSEPELEKDFAKLSKFLLTAHHDYFLYRDFQSRNIMLHEGSLFFLDYQGGRKGALQYDVASLLFDAKADLPPAVRQHLLDHYLSELANFLPLTREAFMQHYYAYVYVRIMQALGAYGFRGFYERKPHFLQSVPYALKNVRWLLETVQIPVALPTLTAALRSMLDSEQLKNLPGSTPDKPEKPTGDQEGLAVRIFSFSFHRGGIPKDEYGNGGGFVFDSRAIPNPGRQEQFKAMTGKDAAVIEFLDRQEGVHQFLSHAKALVDASIRTYQQRGFKNLMVSFGCTGGQHRSVYFAEQLAKALRERNGLEVSVRHLELEKMGK
jgi:aminoglycoside/choline kinase family phosphotransferase